MEDENIEQMIEEEIVEEEDNMDQKLEEFRNHMIEKHDFPIVKEVPMVKQTKYPLCDCE